MKKSKLLGLTVSSVLALSLVAGGVYAWFVSQKVSAQVEVETGKIRLCTIPELVGSTNNLPGEKIIILDYATGIPYRNVGTRDAVIRLSFDKTEAHLASGVTPLPEFASDYVLDTSTGTYALTDERLKEVITDITADETAFGTPLYRVDDDFYFFLKAQEDTVGSLGFEMEISGELGGGMKDGAGGLTPLRQFEQGTVFNVQYEAYAVQNNRGACLDVYGAEAYNQFPADLLANIDDTF